MIGQVKLLEELTNLKLSNKLSHFIILQGNLGMGRHTLLNTLAENLDVDIVSLPSNIDSLRNLIETSQTNLLDTFYIIENCDSMSENAKNAILKFCEEPPKQVYIFMLVENLDNILDTLKSRAQLYNLSSYSKSELMEFMRLNNITMDNLLDIAKCPGDILRLLQDNNKNIIEYTKKVVNNLGRVSISNGLKITKTININKSTTSGFDYDLFLNSLECSCMQKYLETKDEKFIRFVDIIVNGRSSLQKTGINKLYELDNIIIKGWLLWNSQN